MVMRCLPYPAGVVGLPGKAKLRLTWVAIGCLLGAQGALAQVPRAEQDPAQRLLQEQRERERQQELDRAPSRIDVPKQEISTQDIVDIEVVPETGPVFLVDHIEFVGDEVLPQSALMQIAQPFLNRSLGSARIDLLLRRLTERFVQDGLITTRAYLGEQNLRSGKLVITLVSGKIESIRLNGEQLSPSDPSSRPDSGGWLTDVGLRMAMPAAPSDVLKLADLEQGVEQINRMRRNKAELQILPGTSPGGSVIGINNRAGDRFWFNAGIDNYGSQQTGLNRTRLGMEADNLLGFQEVVSLNYSGSRETNALVASASVPFGYNTLSYTTSLSEYQSLISDTVLP